VEVAIRPIELSDIAGFSACTAAVVAERHYLAHVEPFPIDETAKFVALNIRTGNPQFVADDGGRVVGWCDIVRGSLPVHSHRGTLGIGMLAAHRGQGLGTRLMRATLDAARGKGFEHIGLVVYGRNTHAQALYRKAGFREIGRRTRGKKLDGQYDDEVLMELVFDEVRP